MNDLLIEKIDSLPPLPKSVIQIEQFRVQAEKEPLDLLKIIEQDPLIITSLLRVANSAMFGFRSAVETPGRAINLLGVNFTISIALGSVVQDLIKTDLKSYGASIDDFLDSCNLSSSIVSLWLGASDFELKEELLLPAFLQETGKFIISDLLFELGKEEEFEKGVAEGRDIVELEKELVAYSCASITSKIFKHWKLSDNLVLSIGFVGNSDKAPEEFKRKVQILEIVKILSDITAPLSDKNIEKALLKTKEFELDVEALKNAIDTIKRKITQDS
ncbi:MAG: HDOD domain-containing protein [Campylobacterales bacterium]|nr:HDOD domain-containing protein [Campylobacterales bacterium]